MHKYKANKTILFVADQIAHSTSKRSVVTANAVISVANEILEPFKPINKNCLLINHGLNKQFEDVAKKQLKVLQEQNLHTTTNKRVQVQTESNRDSLENYVMINNTIYLAPDINPIGDHLVIEALIINNNLIIIIKFLQ